MSETSINRKVFCNILMKSIIKMKQKNSPITNYMKCIRGGGPKKKTFKNLSVVQNFDYIRSKFLFPVDLRITVSLLYTVFLKV